ncbi:solute carrier family 23 protein [Komagataeibacter rhaeticus]|nr:solute carrier family 23 protein [Komagataeibacter rhaeticus]
MAARWLPVWRRARQTDLIAPDEHCGVAQTLLLGVQHVLAMTGSTIIGPLLMGFDPNIAILCSGLGTIVFFCITGGRIPSYLGSSFSFIALVVTLTGYSGHGPNPDIPLACGGIFMAGLLYALIGLVVSVTGSGWIERLMPPSVTGAIGAAIGLNLAPVAARGLGHGEPGPHAAFSPLSVPPCWPFMAVRLSVGCRSCFPLWHRHLCMLWWPTVCIWPRRLISPP